MHSDIKNIQILRGVAACLVVFHHATHAVKNIYPHIHVPEFGHFGVDIFFVISGFIIYLSIVRSNGSARQFLVKRIVRVVPLYWLFTIAVAGLVVFIPSLFNTTQVTIDTLLRSLFFIPHYHPTFQDKVWPLLVPGWSLNFEIFFYALMAVALMIDPLRVRLLLTVTIVLLVLAGFAFPGGNAMFLTYTHPILLEFLGGIYLASAYTNNRLSKSLYVPWLLPLGALSLIVHPTMYDPSFGLPPILPAIAVVAGALVLENKLDSVRRTFWTRLGDASYSIYLSHLFVLGMLRPLENKLSSLIPVQIAVPLFITLGMIASCIAGIYVYRFIEKPLLSFCRHPKSGRNIVSFVDVKT